MEVGLTPKLVQKWTGPYYIVKAFDNYTYKLANCETHKRIKSLIHSNRLKPFHDPLDRATTQPQEARQDSPLRTGEVGNSQTSQGTERQVPHKEPANQEKHKQTTNKGHPKRDQQPKKQTNKGHIQRRDQKWEEWKGQHIDIADILKKGKDKNGKDIYKVKWDVKGLGSSWEPKESLPPWMIRDFHIHKTNSG